jgi:hypothetical protein
LPFHKAFRWAAFFVLILLGLKVYLWCGWIDLEDKWQAIPGHKSLDVIVMPTVLPPWQIVILPIVIIEWLVHFVASRAVIRVDRHLPFSPADTEAQLHLLSLTQWILCIYVTLCLIYLAVSHSGFLDLRPMGTQIFPWLRS